MEGLSSFQTSVFELIKKMKQIYDLKSDDKIISERIQRGSKSPISDSYEEEFARFFLSEILDDRYSFIIDFQLSKYSKDENKYKQFFKPDILVLEDIEEGKKRVCGIFECKCDISYAADEWVEQMHQRIQLFDEYNVKYQLFQTKINEESGKVELIRNHKNEPKRTNDIYLEAVENLKSVGVVLCLANDHSRWDKLTDTSDYDDVHVIYLSDKHLNNPAVSVKDVLETNKDFWEDNSKSYLVNDLNLVLK